jgi:hypothetical protein
MRGLAMESDQLSEYIPTDTFPNRIVALVVDKTFPLERVVTALKDCPWEDVIWCYRDRDTVAAVALEELGIEGVRVPLNGHWKGEKYDLRRSVREFEMMYGCTNVLVFRNCASDVSKHWEGRYSPRAAITIIEYQPKGGKKK